jgi:Bacteriophage, scaffolding protein
MSVVLTSASPDASEEAIQTVFEKHGLERHAPQVSQEVAVDAPEPTRAEYESDADFDAAKQQWESAQVKIAAVAKEKDEAEEETERKVSRFQRKVQREVAARTAELTRQIEELQEKVKVAAPAEPKPTESPRPKRADFGDGDDAQQKYEDALLDWGTKQALARREVADAERIAKESLAAENKRLEENYQDYRAQVEEFKEEHDDWDEVVNQDIPIHTAVQLALLEQPNGAEVTYYLGKHPDWTRKLAELSPLSAVMEVGLLSQRLASGKTATNRASGPDTAWGGEPRTSTRPSAPAPVQPVRTSSTLASMTSRDAAKARDFKAFKKAQRAGR